MTAKVRPEHDVFPVFVYGTLKHGYGNHRALLSGDDSTFIGKGTTVHPFRMKTTTGFPVVMHRGEQNNHPVAGELYEVTASVLRNLDRLEGHPRWYRREEVLVDIENTGVQQSAWMYIATDGFDTTNLPDVPVTDGVYNWSRDGERSQS
jgi:gamma-glutamylcyclotransferase (GGCT)/AIG2-like uncharacterized protein YtfP